MISWQTRGGSDPAPYQIWGRIDTPALGEEIPAGPERDAYVAKLRDEYRADIDIMKLASELVIDAVIPGDRLRTELVTRFARYAGKTDPRSKKKHMVPPV